MDTYLVCENHWDACLVHICDMSHGHFCMVQKDYCLIIYPLKQQLTLLSFLQYMKMMGVNSCSHFFAWVIESVGFLLVTIIILIVILKFGNILPKTNGFILFLYFSDYSFSVIGMSYLISVFFNNTNIAALIGSLIYIIAFFPFIVLVTVDDELSYVVKVFMVSQRSHGMNGQCVRKIDTFCLSLDSPSERTLI